MIKIFDFFKIWIWDIIKYPYRFIQNQKLKNAKTPKLRNKIEDLTIYINIHEWGGYPLTRQKHIKGITPFYCGLKYQLDRFTNYKSQYPLNITITMSDSEKYEDLNYLKQKCNEFIAVSNVGMDFSGYGSFFNKIRYKKNAYVILTNSSVNSITEDFIDNYIKYMELNPDIGILGVSCSSRYCHTLIRNNFNPHLQSFFLLTTIDVLNEITQANGGEFPGTKEKNKHLLIRYGEVQISRLAMQLGYNLAVVKEDGSVIKFNYKSYPLKKGDLRHFVKFPNRINVINNL